MIQFFIILDNSRFSVKYTFMTYEFTYQYKDIPTKDKETKNIKEIVKLTIRYKQQNTKHNIEKKYTVLQHELTKRR